MGDLELLKNQHEVDCALTVLGYCYKFESLKDEVYCQIMKQTTNNKSQHHDSCQKGWRLFSIIGRTQLTHIVAARDLCVTAVSTEIINEEIHLSRYS